MFHIGLTRDSCHAAQRPAKPVLIHADIEGKLKLAQVVVQVPHLDSVEDPYQATIRM